jgi:hypothetical protein
MLFNKDKTKFYCQEYQAWISIDPCEYLLWGRTVLCMNEHSCGFIHDIFSCDYFYDYHGQQHCKCVQEQCSCFGNIEDCTYTMGRICYEQDREVE